MARKKLCIYLVLLGLAAAIGAATGWGLARAFDSDDSSLSRVERSAEREGVLNVPGMVKGIIPINQRFAKEETLAL